MNNEELFKQHILFEFLHNEPNKVSLLYEGRSVVPGIDTILDKIMKMFDGQIYETLNTPAQSTIKVYDNINDIGLSNLFFDKIDSEFSAEYNKNKQIDTVKEKDLPEITAPLPIEGTEETVPCQLVLIAAGFLGSEKYVTDDFKVEVDGRTNVKTEGDNHSSSQPNIYAAGDVRSGQSLVVRAIADGRKAAREVDLALMGYTNL